jgi:RsiW-degrading membrane proteinase PrsW (M82 family)
MASMQCWQCGSEVPQGAFCIVCGHSLAEELAAREASRKTFNADPSEPVRSVRLLSTLFPQLPKAELDLFRIALLLGTAAVVVLTLLRFYPVAVIVAAAVVPLLVVIYVYEVDVYEDEPPLVIGATLVWGIAAGVALALVGNMLAAGGGGPSPIPSADRTSQLVNAAILGVAQVGLILVGPMVLLRFSRFNDALDGATFGVASAAGFAGAYTIVLAFDLLGSGLQPGGEVTAWLLTTLNVALVRPLLLAGALGATCAAFWLRYRGPAGDRERLRLLGNPWAAVLLAAALIVGCGLAGAVLGNSLGIAARAVLAVAAILWLRMAIHVGLRQEAAEIEMGPPITCRNCGNETPHHSFCATCGISLRALPKERGVRRGETAKPA